MNKIYGNTTATPLFLPNRDAPYIPKECTIADNSFYCFELCLNPTSTEDIFGFYYQSGSLQFAMDAPTDVFEASEKAVFFNPNTGKHFVCDCVGYLSYEDYREYEFNNLEQPLDVTTLEDFKKKYTHCGIYSGEYKWMSKTNMFGDVDKALDGILAIQEQLIGGDSV